jgi:hypothetical protein
MTPSRFNQLNRVQTGPKPTNRKVLILIIVLYVTLMGLISWRMWVYSHPVKSIHVKK